MGNQAREVASLIGVPIDGVDKDVRSVLCKIQRRWQADMTRKAKVERSNRRGEEEREEPMDG